MSADQPAARSADEFLASPEARRCLRLMIFETCPIAQLFRATGEDIPRKTEDEQAFALLWLLKLALEHGDEWPQLAAAEIARRRGQLASKKATQQ